MKAKFIVSLIAVGIIASALSYASANNASKLPEDPRTEAIAVVERYFSDLQNGNFEDAVSISDNHMYKDEKTTLERTILNNTHNHVEDFEIISVNDTDPRSVKVSVKVEESEIGELPPVTYDVDFKNGKYKLQLRTVIIDMNPSSPTYKEVEYNKNVQQVD
ncbi:hypothetical protein [Paenibacillus solani]|uniref:DUF4878 domain-containing protein n=1 Tax=Paenibacillus solani TaxID=1705565 RepID=A0A0M1NZS6_9BACL|nr:hypothetical protein [Paenibacillus solani]KOR87763.1 hypothetical protein AM231_00470 [Paenibacillus solani]